MNEDMKEHSHRRKSKSNTLLITMVILIAVILIFAIGSFFLVSEVAPVEAPVAKPVKTQTE